MKFIIFCITLLISAPSYSQLIGWTFEQVVKFKGTDYILAQDTDEMYSLEYKREVSTDGPQYMSHFSEFFSFYKSSNKVFKYLFMGAKKEIDIESIIEKNNQKFKVIDKGKKQPDFQWFDETNNTIYQLSITTSIGSNHKYISYFAIGEK